MNILKSVVEWFTGKLVTNLLIVAIVGVLYGAHANIVMEHKDKIIELQKENSKYVTTNMELRSNLKAQTEAVEDLGKVAEAQEAEARHQAELVTIRTAEKRKLAKELAAQKSKGSLIEDCKEFEKNINASIGE